MEIMDEDWDNLIILDACRYDIFKNHSKFKNQNVEKKVSQGSWTLEFIKSNFVGKSFHDTVYVTSNVFSNIIPERTFHNIIPLYAQEDGSKPQHVAQAALKAHVEYPNKRLLIHFMQPHIPHLTELGQKYGKHIFHAAMNGKISHKELENSYIENLDIVEKHCELLLNELQGKTVITSDHGENLGESGFYSDGTHATKFGFNIPLYGHGFQTEECRLVPWCVIDNYKNRKNIEPSEPVSREAVNKEKMTENLKTLGYLK